MKTSRLWFLGITLVITSNVQADIGEGVQWGEWLLRPHLSASVKYDSNVFLRETDEISDWSVTIGYGLQLTRSTDTLALSASLWGESQRYDRLSDQDHDDWGGDFFLGIETEADSTISIQLKYANVEDVDYQATSIQDYELWKAGVNAGKYVTEQLRAEVRYDYTLKSYALDDLFDWNRHLGTVELASDLTDHSAALFVGQAGVLDSDGNQDRGVYFNTLLGLQSRRTDKVVGKLGIGVIGLESDEIEVTDLGWVAEIDWQMSPLWSLSILSDRVIEPASISRNNYHVISSFSSALRYRPLSSIQVTLRMGYKYYDLQNDYSLGGNQFQKQEDLYLTSLRFDYLAPGGFVEWFVQAEAAEQESTIDGLDYSRYGLMSGIIVRY
jgi:hypothetical protein